MKKLKKLVVLFSVFLASVFIYIIACSDGWNWEFDGSNFAPETFVENSYKPLFLSDNILYERMYSDSYFYRNKDKILQDWNTYLKGDLDTAKIRILLYSLSYEQITALKSGIIPDSLKKITNKLNYNSEKIQQSLDYLQYAKYVEKFSTQELNYWDYEDVVKKEKIDNKYLSQLISKYNNEKDTFLENRYWFLINKAYFYSNSPESIIQFFRITENQQPKNYLYYNVISYLAGIYYNQKNYLNSNYYNAVLFDKSPEFRNVAIYGFHPLESIADQQVNLKMAQNKDEKIALIAMNGYYRDELKAIDDIYSLDPNSETLDFLFARVINKYEKKLYDFYSEDKPIPKVQDVINNQDVTTLKKITTAQNTHKPYLWSLGLGYISFLMGDFNQASHYYDITESSMPKTELSINQLRLLKLLNQVGSSKNISDIEDETLIKELKWLYFDLEKNQDYTSPLRTNKAKEWIKQQLSNTFEKNEKNNYKILLSSKYEDYSSTDFITWAHSFFTSTKHTKLEDFLMEMSLISYDDILQYETTLAIKSNKIDEAIQFANKSKEYKNSSLLANPFNGFIKDCHDCEFAMPQKKVYTVLDFLKTIKTIQNNVAAGLNLYDNNILLGNAFYNMSYYGNSRKFYVGQLIPDFSSPYYDANGMQNLITSTNLPMYYYQKAFEYATNDEQKAKALYMQSKCERNEYYNKNYFISKENEYNMYNDEVNFLAWNGFKKIKKEYANTQYYRQIIQECGYFRTYISH